MKAGDAAAAASASHAPISPFLPHPFPLLNSVPQALVTRDSVPLRFVVTPQIAAALEDASNDAGAGERGGLTGGTGSSVVHDPSEGREASASTRLPAGVADEFHQQLMSG